MSNFFCNQYFWVSYGQLFNKKKDEACKQELTRYMTDSVTTPIKSVLYTCNFAYTFAGLEGIVV